MSRDTTLVSAQWVEDHLDDPKIVLVEVDEDTAAYDKGHIKGAIKLDWTTDLQDQVRRDFVSKAQFEALLSSRGVANDRVPGTFSFELVVQNEPCCMLLVSIPAAASCSVTTASASFASSVFGVSLKKR